MKSLQFRRNITIILSTFFVVILLYLLYTQVYMRNREEQLIQTRFRVLDQMGENFKAKMDSYKKNADAYRNEVNASLKVLESLQNQYSLVLQLKDLEALKLENPKLKDSINPIQNSLKINIKELRKIQKNQLGINLENKFEDLPEIQKALDEEQKNIQDAIDNYSKVYNGDLKFIKGYNKELINQIALINDSTFYLEVSNDSAFISSRSMKFYLPGEFLLQNIQRKDVFNQSLVIADSSAIYFSLDEDLKVAFIDPSLVKQDNRPVFNTVKKSDTLFLPFDGGVKAATIYSNRCYDIILSDGPYKLFLKPVRIDQLDLFICGLVNYEDFRNEKQSIAPWFIIVLSLLLLMIVLCLPFVKLKVMSRTEMLGTGTIVYSGIAFLLGATFLVHFLFFQAFNLARVRENDEKLKDFSDEIKNSLSGEMKLIYKQLFDADNSFTDYFRNDTEKSMTDILSDHTIWKIDHYSFFDYIIWLDSSGMAITQITPFSVKEKLLNYSYRDYFRFKDEWYWPDTVYGNDNKFMMGPIVSVTSGDYKASFSRPSHKLNISGDTITDNVIVMTGRFYSLIDPILPKGYKFCIIDKSGKVWFHSNKYQNQAENFIRECNDNRLLKAALYSEVSKSMNVNYYNYPHRIHLEPLSNLPLYQVTMYDLRLDYSNQAQVFITTLLLITGLLIYLLLQVLMLLILKRIFKDDQIPGNFQIEFINFRKSKIADYIRITWFFIFTLILFYFFILPMPDVMSITSIIIMVTVLFTILFIYLQDFKSKSPAIYIFIIINALIVITLIIYLFYLEHNYSGNITNSTVKIIVGLFLLLVIVIIAYPSFKPDKPNSRSDVGESDEKPIFNKFNDWLKRKPDVAYPLVILLMVILFGVAPVMKFFDISANLENNINIRYGQLELASAREARNIEFDNYYKRIENIGNTGKNDFRDTAHHKRKEKGIYTNFWHSTGFDSLKAVSQGNMKGQENIESLVNAFRPVYKDGFSVFSKYLLIDSIENRSFNWKKSEDTLMLVYKSPTEDLHRQEKKMRVIKTVLPKTNIIDPFGGNVKSGAVLEIILILLFLAIIFLFFKLIRFTARKVFGVSFIKDFTPSDLEHKVNGHIKNGNPVMLVNPSSFIGYKGLVEKISKEYSANEFHWIDPADVHLSEVWLVSDLHKDFHDPETFSKKLNTLLKWLKTSEKLLILMDINPEAILNYYSEKAGINKKPDPKAEKGPDDAVERFGKTLDLFKTFMNRVVVLYIPVGYPDHGVENETVSNLSQLKNKVDENPMEQIARELSPSKYFVGFHDTMEGYLSYLESENLSNKEIKQLIVIRISEMAEKYYQCLLETCSTEEKFVLLDLAFDNIANIENKQVIVKLLRRGILINGSDSVEFMNDSFRYFLVSHYSRQNKEECKKALGIGPSNWTGYKFAILLVIVSLFVFIFISNQEFLQNMNKLFLTIGASIAGITSVLGLLGRKAKES